MGFFVICAGVVLLQLSKSAKDVPDTAVFAGDLDQVRTIAEQEQPESEPKADAIRGAAAIVRRLSTTRQKKEMEEAKRLHDEKQQDLEPIGENEHIEWDGLRRRRTTFGTQHSARSGNHSPFPTFEGTHGSIRTPVQHPPLGMSQFPDSDSEHDEERPSTAGAGFASSFLGSIRSRTKSTINPGRQAVQSPMHPVPLTEISIPSYTGHGSDTDTAYYGHQPHQEEHVYGLPPGLRDHEPKAGERHITIAEDPERAVSRGSSLHPGPTPPPHSARRQFSFQNVFRKSQSHAPPEECPRSRKGPGARKNSAARPGSQAKGATEEERLGLVKGDSRVGRLPTALDYRDQEEEEDEFIGEDKVPLRSPQSSSPPRRAGKEREVREKEYEAGGEEEYYERQRRNWDRKQGKGKELPKPPTDDEGKGGGAFI